MIIDLESLTLEQKSDAGLTRQRVNNEIQGMLKNGTWNGEYVVADDSVATDLAIAFVQRIDGLGLAPDPAAPMKLAEGGIVKRPNGDTLMEDGEWATLDGFLFMPMFVEEEYDASGRLIRKTEFADAAKTVKFREYTWTYDGAGVMTSHTDKRYNKDQTVKKDKPYSVTEETVGGNLVRTLTRTPLGGPNV